MRRPFSFARAESFTFHPGCIHPPQEGFFQDPPARRTELQKAVLSGKAVCQDRSSAADHDRPCKGKRTCKQVGAKLFFEKGIEADTFLLQYLTEYNKVYSRRYRAAGKYAEEHSGKDLTEEQFKFWSAAAS